jgi:hypothetical protein
MIAQKSLGVREMRSSAPPHTKTRAISPTKGSKSPLRENSGVPVDPAITALADQLAPKSNTSETYRSKKQADFLRAQKAIPSPFAGRSTELTFAKAMPIETSRRSCASKLSCQKRGVIWRMGVGIR